MQMRTDIAARAVERVAELADERTESETEIREEPTSQRSAEPQPTPRRCPRSRRPSRRSRSTRPLVGIIMGSKNDKPKMQPAGEALHEAGIRYEVRVMSAHRDPELVARVLHQRAHARA